MSNKNTYKDKEDLVFSIEVDQTPEQVFEAVTNVTKWWTENLKGSSKKLNDEFEVFFGDIHYSKQKLIEVIPNKKVVWLITESRLSFIENKSEWTGTTISFEISAHDGKTELRFSHHGLTPGIECYDACSETWGGYITNSLRNLIIKGKGKPEPKE